jgi:hypothetical protein
MWERLILQLGKDMESLASPSILAWDRRGSTAAGIIYYDRQYCSGYAGYVMGHSFEFPGKTENAM